MTVVVVVVGEYLNEGVGGIGIAYVVNLDTNVPVVDVVDFAFSRFYSENIESHERRGLSPLRLCSEGVEFVELCGVVCRVLLCAGNLCDEAEEVVVHGEMACSCVERIEQWCFHLVYFVCAHLAEQRIEDCRVLDYTVNGVVIWACACDE